MPIVMLWLTIDSQWCTVPLASGQVHWIGLNYAAVKAGFELAQAVVTPGLWAGVQVMERAAVAALNGLSG